MAGGLSNRREDFHLAPLRSLEEVAAEYHRRHGGRRMTAKHVAACLYLAHKKLRHAIESDPNLLESIKP